MKATPPAPIEAVPGPASLLRPSIGHATISILLIVTFLFATGTAATWLFHRDWQEKTIAVSMMIAPTLLAWLQYQSTFRADAHSAGHAIWLNGVIATIIALILLGNLPGFLGAVTTRPDMIPWNNLLVWIGLFGAFATNAALHWNWRARLKSRPDLSLPKSNVISLREIMLLVLAFGFVSGVTSYFVRLGWHYSYLF